MYVLVNVKVNVKVPYSLRSESGVFITIAIEPVRAGRHKYWVSEIMG